MSFPPLSDTLLDLLGPDRTDRVWDVVIVGAGIAGLVAARDAVAAGLSVRVVEARERVGGRVLNHRIGDSPGDVVELGGQWLGPTQDRAYALAADLDLATYPTHISGANLLERADGAISRYRGTIPRVNPLALADFAQAKARLERLARRVPPEAPWTAPSSERLDAQTFASWIARSTVTPLARDMLRLACVAVFCAEPDELSLLHVLFYMRSGGGLDSLLDTDGGAQQDRIVGGSGLLAERLARRLIDQGVTVQLSAPVRRITSSEHEVVVEGDGDAVRARRAIVAVPPALAGRITFDPPLPPARDAVTQRMPMGSVIKTMAIYPEPFWRRVGLSGQATSVRGPVGVVFDNTPPSGSPGVLLGFLEGDEARRLAVVLAVQRREIVLDALSRLFGAAAGQPDSFVERDWTAEEFTRGGYAGVMGPGTWTRQGTALREPVGLIHWAGTETAERWCGYIDGAVRSGERAAHEIVTLAITSTVPAAA